MENKVNKCIFVFLYLIIHVNCQITLTALINNVENEVKSIRNDLQTSLTYRCTKQEKICSYISCSKKFPLTICNSDFILKKCNKEECKGHNLVMDQFMVKLADKYSKVSQYEKGVRELVNGSVTINKKFIEVNKKNSNLYKWMYFGGYNGAHMSYPGKVKCVEYDNRYRPWYVGATTGTKNFILLIDTSELMKKYSPSLNEASAILLDTLIYSDWVGVITFNKKATFFKPTLIRATKSNLTEIKKYLEKIDFEERSNFSEAFSKTNNLIKSTVEDEFGTSCKKTFIMFFTDGNPSEGETDPDKLLNFINNQEHLKTSIVFTYNFSNKKYNELSKIISCLKKGINENISPSGVIIDKLDSYFTRLSLGSNLDEPVWVEPYTDSSGL